MLLLAATAANCRPLTGGAGDLVTDADWAWQYLEEFGYINEASTKFVSSKRKVLANAIADFQSFSGLNVTCEWTRNTANAIYLHLLLAGDLNDETLQMMHARRCGNKDVIVDGRAKRFALHGSRY